MKLLEKVQDISGIKFVSALLLLYLLFSLPLLTHWPAPMIDEAMFGSTAKTFVERGYLGTSLVRGLESHVYWQPPLYFLTIDSVIKVAGYGLVVLRIFSVIVGAIIIVLVSRVAEKLGDVLTGKVAVFVLVCDPYFVKYVKFARMDGLCILLLLFALWVLLAGPNGKKSNNAFLVGSLLALAMLTHPMGWAGAVAVGIFIFSRSELNLRLRLQTLLLVFIPIFIAMLLWGIYISQDWNDFAQQINYQFARKSRPVFVSISNFIGQYSTFPLSLFLPAIGLVFITKRAFRSPSLKLLVFVFGGVWTVVMLKGETPYHVYIAPLGAISISILLSEMLENKDKLKKYATVIVLGAVFANALAVTIYLNYLYRYPLAKVTDYNNFTELVSSHLPRDATVCGWGTPSLYWGLVSQRPDIRFRDAAFLNAQYANEAGKQLDAVVLTRCFRPEEDKIVMERRHEFLAGLLARNGRQLKRIEILGSDKRFAYSAEVYRVSARIAK